MSEEKKPNFVPSLEDFHYYLFNKEFDHHSTGDAITFILQRNLMPSPPKQIKMLFTSPGGMMTSCFALIDTMKGSKVPIFTYGLGEIYSCALFAFVAGEKGKRFVTRNTSILSHQFSWHSGGKDHELMAQVPEINNLRNRLVEHFRRCTPLTKDEILKYLLPPQDVYLTAKEAVKLGLADEIVEFY